MQYFPYIPKSSEDVLKRAIYRSRREPYGDFYGEDPPVFPAPELILVKIPEGGIPAATVPDNGKYELVCGKAECDIYYFLRDATQLFTENSQEPDVSADIIVKPIMSLANELDSQDQPTGKKKPKKEWIYNPYRYKNYGRVRPISGSENSNDPIDLYCVAYRDRSGFFICERPRDTYKAKTYLDIEAGQSGTCTLYAGTTAIGTEANVFNNWMNNGLKVSAGVECLIRYFEEERRWVIINAACETP